ncbi:MAG: SUMF1/EgtB/PvdO family nonheme iron enzyme [Bacteroidales bacterium]|nr:SUMF1/EgtB/PvdO family nonheme iron enzyme [Bacteroidales bacterium]
MRKLTLTVLLIIILSQVTWGNNVAISNVAINADDVTFDLSWDNSWKDLVNHDAIWIFIKFRVPNGDWLHATLSATGHNIPTGASIDLPADRKGVFVTRAGNGSGTNTFSGFSLSWNHVADGIQNTANIQVKVIGIEMVYIPTSDFFLGDGHSTGTFGQQSVSKPVRISDQNTVVRASSSGDDPQIKQYGILVNGAQGIDKDGLTAADNPDYPTGYNAFYIMKYEMSQEQYKDFLVTINSFHAYARYPSMGSAYPISGVHPSLTAAQPERSMYFLSWSDALAYADWAGLRPLTELEYEKSCRGPLMSINGEYAWGNTTIHASSYLLQNAGQSNEGITNPGNGTGNALYNLTSAGLNAPLRCGIFSSIAVNASRVETGSSYYGVMELSGNVFEHCVTLGNVSGRSFNGAHGDGSLNVDGNANVSGWPGYLNGAVTTAAGAGFRGGAWNYFRESLLVSSRYYATSSDNNRNSSYGFRAARSAN